MLETVCIGGLAGLGTTEWLLILGAIALLFGASKIPEIAKNLGRAGGEFKKARNKAQKEAEELENELEEIKETKEE